MISEIIRFTSFLLPIPFIILFNIRTNKLNFLKKYGILTLFIPIFFQLLFVDIGFHLHLIFAYMIFVLFGMSIFNSKGWAISQALSISFCLVYFGSFLWELPIHIYTIIIRGGIDGAFSLHLLYIFPMVFIFDKLKTNQPKREILELLLIFLGWSTFIMFMLVGMGLDLWNILANPLFGQIMMQSLWMLNRMVVIFGLFAIYIKSSLRKESKI